MAWDGPKWGQEDFVPTNPALADILGRTELNFEIFFEPTFLDFQVLFSSVAPCCYPPLVGLLYALHMQATWSSPQWITARVNRKFLFRLIQTVPTFWMTWM